MPESNHPLPPLSIARDLYDSEGAEPLEIFASSLIVSHMLWPDDIRSRSLYMTLCLSKIHVLLLRSENEAQAHMAFSSILKRYYGGWQQFYNNLNILYSRLSGKGSILERAQQGILVGKVFLLALSNSESGDKTMSLRKASGIVSKALHDPSIDEDFPKPSQSVFMKRYWPRFRPVAHFWAATDYFVMPEIQDSIIRLDQAEPLPEWQGSIKPGWRGIVDFAEFYLKKAEAVKRYKTHKPLLDREQAMWVSFD